MLEWKIISVAKASGHLRAEVELSTKSKFWRAVGPILAGFLLDVVDFMTAGPMGIAFGFVAGFGVSFLLTSFFDMSPKKRFWVALLGGAYCTLPFTETMPCGAIVAGLSRYVADASEPKEREKDEDALP